MRGNGGIIGPAHVPTELRANGVWNLDEVMKARSLNAWPGPTKLLLRTNGADGSASFIDASPFARTVTAVGNAQVDTAQTKFGPSSLLFDGTGDRVSVPDSPDFAFGTGDFTIDWWMRFSSVATASIFAQASGAATDLSFDFQYFSGSFFFVNSANGTSSSTSESWSNTPSSGVWNHWELVRNGTNLILFKDGVSLGTESGFSTTLFDSSSPLTVGGGLNISAALNGWIEEFRVTKGIARHTANFTPPTAPYS